MFGKNRKIQGLYGPGTFYIHEKNVPYPYYMQQPQQHHCIITLDDHKHIMPHYIVPLIILGAVLLFSLFTIALLLLVERARLTPVVRARLHHVPSEVNFNIAEEMLIKALDVYNRLNS